MTRKLTARVASLQQSQRDKNGYATVWKAKIQISSPWRIYEHVELGGLKEEFEKFILHFRVAQPIWSNEPPTQGSHKEKVWNQRNQKSKKW